MKSKERNKLRADQDKLLASHAMLGYIKAYGENYPIWKNGPTVAELRTCIYPQWAHKVREALA